MTAVRTPSGARGSFTGPFSNIGYAAQSGVVLMLRGVRRTYRQREDDGGRSRDVEGEVEAGEVLCLICPVEQSDV